MSDNLLDLFPKEGNNFNFFSKEEEEKVLLVVQDDSLSRKAFNHARSVEIGDKESVDIFPENFQRELAEVIEKTIPDSSIAAKIALYLKAEHSFAGASKHTIEKRVSESYISKDLEEALNILKPLYEKG